jgi:hypothetical protein
MQTKFEVMERKYMELEGNMHKLMEMIQENPKLAQVKPEALIKKK